MDEKKAKGSMLLDLVKMIKANKTLDWNKYLRPEDWQVINSIILPSQWYPFGVYHRCATAAFYLLARGDLQVARANGRRMARNLFENTYRSMVRHKDPMQGLNQFVLAYSSLFTSSMLRMAKVGPRHARIFHDYRASDKGNTPYCHQLQGVLETLVQMTGGRNGKVVIGERQWEGAPATIFDVTWE